MSYGESKHYSMRSENEHLREYSYTLSNWIGVNNDMKKFGKQDLDEKEMLIDENDWFQENYKRQKSAIEYTGYESCSQEVTYKKTAIVISPRNFAFLVACKEDLTSVILGCKNYSEKSWKMFCGIMDYIKTNYSSKKQLGLARGSHPPASLKFGQA